MVDPLSISCSSQCATTGVTKPVFCAILSGGWCIKETPCCKSERVAHVVEAAGFISRCLSGILPYV